MNVYYSMIDEDTDLSGSELITPARRSRMHSYYRPEDQKACLVSGLLLRTVLGIDPAMNVETDPNGKPFVSGGPFFNLTHIDDMAALVVANCEVGIDAEEIRGYSDDVAARHFTPDEIRWMEQQEDKEEAFYTLWTGKESIMKATGQGFRLAPDSFSIMPVEDGLHYVAGAGWYLQWECIDGRMLCVACARPEPMFLTQVEHATLLGRADQKLR